MIEILFASTIHTIVTCIVLLILLFCIGDDKFTIPSVLLVAFCIYVGVWKRPEITEWYVANKKTLWTCVAAYFPIGLLYSLLKYRMLLQSVPQKDLDYHKPQHHKADITGWIGYWPFSLIGFLVTDVVTFCKDYVYDKFRGLFERIWRKMSERKA